MPRIYHLKNNPSKIPFPKQTRSSWSNASFHKSPIYYLSRSKINTLITARSIHPYTKTTFLRAVDKVTHHQTISINNQLDPPSTFLCSKKKWKGKEEKDRLSIRLPTLLLLQRSSNGLVDSLEIISPFSTRGDRPQGHSRINDSHRPCLRNRATRHHPCYTLFLPSRSPHPPPSFPSLFRARAAVARYIISQDPTFVCGEAGHVAQNRGCISRVAAACTGDACSGARVPAIGCTGRNALRGKSGE